MSTPKPRRPRPVTAHTMALAMNGATKPPRTDIAQVVSMLRASIDALRQGRSVEHDWSVLAGSLALAKAIERQGVVRGLIGHLDGVDLTLKEIYARSKTEIDWHCTLYGPEIETLLLFEELHTYQLQQLSRAELEAAVVAAQRHIKRDGFGVQVVREVSAA